VWEWYSALSPQELERVRALRDAVLAAQNTAAVFLDSSPPPHNPHPQVFTITDQHWVEYVLRLEQFLLQRKVSSGERPCDPARCDAPLASIHMLLPQACFSTWTTPTK
jgi:hypothetical protein